MDGPVQHFPELCAVPGREDRHVRNAGHVGNVKKTVVRLSVPANQSCTVEKEDDRQFLERCVHDDLVIGTLEETGIDGGIRMHPALGQPCGKRDGMLFRDADVEEAVPETLFEAMEADVFPHGRRDRADLRMLLAAFSHEAAENIRVSGFFVGFRHNAGFQVKRTDAVIQ